ncbi:response regulator transcription factor [Pseudomonas huanghezhanensis]|uniref:response regulator transcription factor n=1 Tax=Pseudomonas huanghezhanensis TaxID=3002903 RepID=UPI0022856780|nr:LuxR C-terminal-related transcriptional regulator [Pseudomonas sp. BSw22131]
MNTGKIIFGNVEGTIGFLAAQELRATLAICTGLANKEIARVLNCAPGTVKKSVERTFFKLGVSNRAALVAEAFKRGLVAFSCGATPPPQNRHDQDHESAQGIFLA